MKAAEVLVTGASGFVGSAVARRLSGEGYRVAALVRKSSPRNHLAGLNLEFREGDLLDADSINTAIAGARYLFHVAADYRLWPSHSSEIVATNVAGTQTIMRAALRAGVERIIYTSSVATLALKPDGTPADESGLLQEHEGVGAYKRSKIAAERLVDQMIADEGLPAVIVNPSTPIGPCDVRPTPTGRIILEAASGRLPAFVDTGLNLAHVDDIAAGQLAALRRGKVGERYILGGQNVLFSEMLAEICRIVGRRAPCIRLPHAIALSVAYMSEAIAFITGREPLATVTGVQMSKKRMFFSTIKAEQELGYRARPHTEGLVDAIRWFRDAGYLTR
jgi:dihydroflavonol-4-reductase